MFHPNLADPVSFPHTPAIAAPSAPRKFFPTSCAGFAASEYSHSRDEEIYGECEPAEYVYQVASGAVRTHKLLNDGRRQIGAFHLPGDIFGLDSGDAHRLTAEAIVDTRVRTLSRCQPRRFHSRRAGSQPTRSNCGATAHAQTSEEIRANASGHDHL